ncbi:hypothetical protein CkaCkLH20_06228 [Colletotrichum karsti]|uniref:Uncharacterized protein n=1 Tax=Colletotrichum karsti TaxID=1095194 RepID=A0A9P6LKP4_9PEZI|nr:uncharacterized protein CkaCkLH20_06228 [Colletotrichum karsti]KAF9876285.1 hypothetical protein CkaCkLH20_06228 [Colletotrichum karsti]
MEFIGGAAIGPWSKSYAIDWRPSHDGNHQSDDDVLTEVMKFIQAKNGKILDIRWIRDTLERHLPIGYQMMFDMGQMRVSIESSLLSAMVSIWLNDFKLTPEEWLQNNLGPIRVKALRLGMVADHGYAEWLETNRPEFFKLHSNEILDLKEFCWDSPKCPSPPPAAIDSKSKWLALAEQSVNHLSTPVIGSSLQDPTIAEAKTYRKSTNPVPTIPSSSHHRNVVPLASAEEVFGNAKRHGAHLSQLVQNEIEGWVSRLDPSILGSDFRKFEVRIPRDIDHDRCYRSVMKEVQQQAGMGLGVAWASRDTESFFIPFVSQNQPELLLEPLTILWSRLSSYSLYLETMSNPVSLPDYLREQRREHMTRCLLDGIRSGQKRQRTTESDCFAEGRVSKKKKMEH